MPWQDAVFAVGQIVFAIALVPALMAIEKPPRSSCYLTAGVLLVFAPTFATLALYYGAAMNAIVGLMWLRLAMQPRPRSLCAWPGCTESAPFSIFCRIHEHRH